MTKPLVPLPALIADIGGTNSRFALLTEDGTLTDLLTFPIAEGSDFTAAVAERVIPAFASRPRSAVLALAGMIGGERVKIVNGGWYVEPRRLLETIGLDDVVLINDFEALALALPAFQDDALVPIGNGGFAPDEAKLVIGPGTGLGIAALIPVGDRWLPVATEGGHMDFGPAHPREFEIWPFLSPTGARVQVETVLSGPGIENLYRAIATVEGDKAASRSVRRKSLPARRPVTPLPQRRSTSSPPASVGWPATWCFFISPAAASSLPAVSRRA